MAWNEPGNHGQRDPWNRPRPPVGKYGLEQAWRRIKARLGKLGGPGGAITIVLAFVLAWLLWSACVVIAPDESGVVLRFGQYARTLGPGLHFKLPRPFETVDMVQTARLRSMAGSVRMLTRDQDLVVVDFSTRYQVLDARRYLYAMDDVEDGIAAAAEAAVRGAVGRQGLEQLLAGSRAALAAEATQALQHSLDGYGAGVRVAGIDVQNIAPPPEIKDAFDDVDKAREDRQGAEDGAHAYADKVLPIARGDAARIAAEAAGYKTARIARAQGDAERFGLLLKAYRAAPEVTRRRLWLEMMEDVLAGNAKVIDGRDGRDVINLPPAPLAAPASVPVTPSPSPAGAVAPGDAETKP